MSCGEENYKHQNPFVITAFPVYSQSDTINLICLDNEYFSFFF